MSGRSPGGCLNVFCSSRSLSSLMLKFTHIGSLEYSVVSNVCCAVISEPGLTSELLIDAVARRAQRREFEIELHVAHQRFLRLHQRAAGALLCHRRVVVLLAHCFLRDQPGLTGQILPGVDQIRLGLRETRLRLRELRFEWPLIDHVEHVAALHPRAVGERLPLEQAGHLAADLDRVRRLRLRHVLVVHRDLLGFDLDHRHFRRWRCLRASHCLCSR